MELTCWGRDKEGQTWGSQGQELGKGPAYFTYAARTEPRGHRPEKVLLPLNHSRERGLRPSLLCARKPSRGKPGGQGSGQKCRKWGQPDDQDRRLRAMERGHRQLTKNT